MSSEQLRFICKKAWNTLYPHRKLVWSWHYDYLCEVLTLVKERTILRLIVNVPPRTLKSTLITVLFPAWVWTTNPEHEFLTASYALDLSLDYAPGAAAVALVPRALG
jgi:hypothetical protein